MFISCRTGWGRPDNPCSCIFRYNILEFPRDNLLKFLSCQMVTLVFTRLFHASLEQAWPPCRTERGDGRPDRRQSWPGGGVAAAHLQDVHYYCVDSGNSLRRNKSAGMGEELLSLRKPLSILFWKISNDLVLVGRIGRAGRPVSRAGRLHALQWWACTTGTRNQL